MTEKIREVYKSAKKNKQFNDDILRADGDTPPNFFSNEIVKHIYTTTYYGWLVAKYGENWKQHL